MIIPTIIAFVIINVLGFVWYSKFLFGKQWMAIVGPCEDENGKPKKMKGMAGVMGLQFATSFIQTFATNFLLALLIPLNLLTTIICSSVIFLGFIMPVVAGNALWSGKPCKVAWKMFAISAGFQLVTALVIALVYWVAK